MHTSLIISVPKIEAATDLKKEKNEQNKKIFNPDNTLICPHSSLVEDPSCHPYTGLECKCEVSPIG